MVKLHIDLTYLLAMIWLLRILNLGKRFILFSVILLGLSLVFFKTVFLGLEFGLFSFFILLFFGSFLLGLDYPDYLRGRRGWSILSGVLGTALFATRPEALILPLIIFLITFLLFWKKPSTISHLKWSSSIFILLVIAISGWRFFTTGS